MKPEHLKFAQLFAPGGDCATAYMAAYGKTTRTAAVVAAATRLAAKDHIKAKIQQLRERAAKESDDNAVLSIAEKRKRLAELLRTPVTDLDPDDKKTKHLIKKVVRKMIGTGEKAETVTEIEGYDQLRVIQIDSELAGETPDGKTADAFSAFLLRLPNQGMTIPNDSMEE